MSIKPKKVRIKPYPIDLVIHWVDDFKEFEKKYGFSDMSGFAAFVHSENNNGEIICAFVKDIVTNKIIVHESKHIVNRIFTAIGQELDLENDEVECYLLEHIFEILTNELDKLKK